jgi:DNA-damage-inducible protein D
MSFLREGNESVTKCNRLKMEAADGKKYLTDAADPETLLRLIQSVPSPKAEPIKLRQDREKSSPGIGIKNR